MGQDDFKKIISKAQKNGTYIPGLESREQQKDFEFERKIHKSNESDRKESRENRHEFDPIYNIIKFKILKFPINFQSILVYYFDENTNEKYCSISTFCRRYPNYTATIYNLFKDSFDGKLHIKIENDCYYFGWTIVNSLYEYSPFTNNTFRSHPILQPLYSIMPLSRLQDPQKTECINAIFNFFNLANRDAMITLFANMLFAVNKSLYSLYPKTSSADFQKAFKKVFNIYIDSSNYSDKSDPNYLRLINLFIDDFFNHFSFWDIDKIDEIIDDPDKEHYGVNERIIDLCKKQDKFIMNDALISMHAYLSGEFDLSKNQNHYLFSTNSYLFLNLTKPLEESLVVDLEYINWKSVYKYRNRKEIMKSFFKDYIFFTQDVINCEISKRQNLLHIKYEGRFNENKENKIKLKKQNDYFGDKKREIKQKKRYYLKKGMLPIALKPRYFNEYYNQALKILRKNRSKKDLNLVAKYSYLLSSLMAFANYINDCFGETYTEKAKAIVFEAIALFNKKCTIEKQSPIDTKPTDESILKSFADFITQLCEKNKVLPIGEKTTMKFCGWHDDNRIYLKYDGYFSEFSSYFNKTNQPLPISVGGFQKDLLYMNGIIKPQSIDKTKGTARRFNCFKKVFPSDDKKYRGENVLNISIDDLSKYGFKKSVLKKYTADVDDINLE